MVLTVSASQTSLPIGGNSTVTADLTHDNTGANTSSLGYLPDGILIKFGVNDSSLGNNNPITVSTLNGIASTTFTGFNNGLAKVYASLDAETQNTNIKIGQVNLLVTNYAWYSGVYTYDYKQQIIMLAEVINQGATDASNITVTYQIGNAFKVVSYNLIQPGTLIFDNTTNTFTWTISSLNGGLNNAMTSYASFAVQLESLETGSGTSDFSCTDTITNCDQNNTGTQTTRTRNLIINPSADIQVNQTINNTTPKQGDYVTITINVTNNGPNTATGITINDLLPNGLYVDPTDPQTSITTTNGTTYNQNTGNWTIPTLTNGTTVTLTIIARVNATNGTTITNRAYKTAYTQYDWQTGNDASSINFTVSPSQTPTTKKCKPTSN